MKATLPNLKKLAGRGRTDKSADSVDIQQDDIESNQAAAEPKPPPPLSLFFMLSHLEEDGPVRLDGMKLAVMRGDGAGAGRTQVGRLRRFPERPGLPGATAGAPAPAGLGNPAEQSLTEAQPEDLPQQTRDAADSLGRLLTTLEAREGILDRRFYAVCEHNRMDELRGLLARAGLGVFPLKGQALRLLHAWHRPWAAPPTSATRTPTLTVEVNRRDIRIGGQADPFSAPGQVAPVSLAPGFPTGPDGRRRSHGPVRPP